MIIRLWLFVFIYKLSVALNNQQCSNSISTTDLQTGFRYERNSNPPFYALNAGSVSEMPTGWTCKRQLNVAFPIGPNAVCPSTCLKSLITYYNQTTASFSIQKSVNRLGDYELPAYVSEVHCAIEMEACGATIPLFLIQSPIYGDFIGTEEEKRPRLRRRLRDLYVPICYAWSTDGLKIEFFVHTSNSYLLQTQPQVPQIHKHLRSHQALLCRVHCRRAQLQPSPQVSPVQQQHLPLQQSCLLRFKAQRLSAQQLPVQRSPAHNRLQPLPYNLQQAYHPAQNLHVPVH
ncbi:hypothetical protein M3Y98_00113000 [Aphelenchoides besseyi]|nr:hypothetical protein M3Y98_00113000 [Aphelenchoides besseyi]